MPTPLPDTDAWNKIAADLAARLAAGEHPEDASWDAVMIATATDDDLLDELHRTCPDPEAYAYWDFVSRGAEQQSIVLANLRAAPLFQARISG